MARENDLIDDVTGRPIAEEGIPLAVRITAGVPSTARTLVDPASCGPFLQQLLALPRPAIELSAATFERCFTANMELLEPAFSGDPGAMLRAKLARLEAEAQRVRRMLAVEGGAHA